MSDAIKPMMAGPVGKAILDALGIPSRGVTAICIDLRAGEPVVVRLEMLADAPDLASFATGARPALVREYRIEQQVSGAGQSEQLPESSRPAC